MDYSRRLKTLNSLQDISTLLSEMFDQNILPNAVIINQLINKMKKLNQLDLALELHGVAVSRNIADAITYASTITAIANSATPDSSSALSLFEEAKRLGFANSITYASTIDAIAKSATPDASSALGLFEEAKRLGFANSITYASTIDAIAKSATPDASSALSLFDEATQRFNRPDMKQKNLIDLHGLSYGEVYFGLKRRLENELKNTNHTAINLQIINGQGLHSHARFVAAAHPLKEAVIRVVREMSALGVSGEENQDNTGRFDLTINPHVQSVRHQSSALTQNSIFPNTGNPSLNPNANVFVPRSFPGKSK